MAVVQLLSEHIADQITAGEVIDRPASVVKELIENSLDANAKHIRIEFKAGGKRLIIVEDDGEGMTAEDALLALKARATSKLQMIEDLQSLSTFGFRGEALSSIKSVADVLLKTRPADTFEGIEIVYKAGILIDSKVCGMPIGTYCQVEHLFQMLPTRSAHLKKDIYESALIQQLTRIYAIAYPQVAFHLTEGRKSLFRSPACNTLKDRILEIWGNELQEELLPVSYERDAFHIEGFISKPMIQRSSRRDIIWIVNGRPVDSFNLNALIYETYQPLLPKGKYPICFLFFKLPSAYVDINVHPMKREIRLLHLDAIRFFILDALKQALGNQVTASLKPNISPDFFNSYEMKTPSPVFDGYNQQATTYPFSLSNKRFEHIADYSEAIEKSLSVSSIDWMFMGIFTKQYALFSTQTRLTLVNIQAAIQRIQYEAVFKLLRTNNFSRQILNLSNVLALTPLQAAYLSDNIALWFTLGFELEPFGFNQFKVATIPDFLETGHALELIMSLLDQAIHYNKALSQEYIAKSITKLSSTSKQYEPTEFGMKALLNELLLCETPMICPDNKLTLIDITLPEIQKRFLK